MRKIIKIIIYIFLGITVSVVVLGVAIAIFSPSKEAESVTPSKDTVSRTEVAIKKDTINKDMTKDLLVDSEVKGLRTDLYRLNAFEEFEKLETLQREFVEYKYKYDFTKYQLDKISKFEDELINYQKKIFPLLRNKAIQKMQDEELAKYNIACILSGINDDEVVFTYSLFSNKRVIDRYYAKFAGVFEKNRFTKVTFKESASDTGRVYNFSIRDSDLISNK